jgi:hypothetical protein
VRVRRLGIFAASLAIVLAASLLPAASATVQRPRDAASSPAARLSPEHEEIVKRYLQDYPHLTRDEVIPRVLQQGSRLRLLEFLGTAYGDSFGGAWFDRGTGRLHLNVLNQVTAQAAEVRARQLGINVSVHSVKHSYTQLEELASRVMSSGLSSTVRQADVSRVRIDVSRNVVQIFVQPGSLARAASSARSFHPAVRLAGEARPDDAVDELCTDRLHCGAPLRSGVVIWEEGRGNICSLGYRAAASDGTKWAVSAGHCASALNRTWGHGEQYFGLVRQLINVVDMDVARARVSNSYWLQTGGGYQYNARSPDDPKHIDYAILNRSTIAPGDYVCLNAWHSLIGVSCGDILFTFDNYRVRVNFDACPGDSGGAWTWGEIGQYWAYGIHESGTDGCHEAGGWSRFYAVPDINDYWDQTAAHTIRIETR